MHIVLDFETRSRYPIKAGASRYSLDPSTDVLCLAYQIDDSPVKLWKPGDENPQDLFDAIAAGAAVWAHNVTFEIAIWQNVMVERYFWPEIPPRQWRCTMAECMAVGLPSSLENVGKALGIASDSLKDKAGHRVMLKLSKPRKPTKNNKSEWHDKPEDFEKLYEYCKQDVVAEAAIHKRVPRLNNRELSVFHYDKVVNGRGVKIDRGFVEAVVSLRDEHKKRLIPELESITEGRVKTAREVQNLISELQKYKVWTSDLDADSVSNLLEKDDLHPTARRILEIRQELSLSSVDKFDAMLRSVEPDDRIRGAFQYHGAQTGRWAGRIVQLQNLPRGFFSEKEYLNGTVESVIKIIKRQDYDDFIAFLDMFNWKFGKTLSALVRSAFVADVGKKYIVSDFASVEARGVAWSADERWLLDVFADKKACSYKHMAADIYGVKYEEVTKDQRFTGKQAVLGCGYGLGGAKFQTMCLGYGVLLPSEFCNKVISIYREKNKATKNFWYELQRAAIRTVEIGKSHQAGPYLYYLEDAWLKCRLPSGRSIAYYQPRLVDGRYGKALEYTGVDQSGKPVKTSTWGGKLLENVVQGICRDLLVHAKSNLEKEGYTTVLHVHDEIVAEVPEGFGSVEEMEAIMCEVPSWAKGFPISAEGFEARRYRK